MPGWMSLKIENHEIYSLSLAKYILIFITLYISNYFWGMLKQLYVKTEKEFSKAYEFARIWMELNFDGMVILPKPEKFKNNVPHRELVNLERLIGVNFRNSRL